MANFFKNLDENIDFNFHLTHFMVQCPINFSI